MGKSKLGLVLTYSSSQGESPVLLAFAEIGFGTKSRDFITSPEIREAIMKTKLPLEAKFGKFMLVNDPPTKELMFISYYPHPTNKGLPGEFSKLGIASAIETRIIQVAKKRFPNTTHIVHYDPMSYRVNQLLKRGHTIEEIKSKIEIKEFEKKLRAKRAQDIRKARAKRILKH